MEEYEKLNGESDDMPGNNGRSKENDFPKIVHLSGMYKDWFMDYASYVILERAVPHLHDGLKPVQRRIMHAMKRLDDGRFNKVANIIGYTMQYHPHGDVSIGDALVQLGQKDLLVETQGNWGNIVTGDGAAASRYIEARLSKFALDVVFNPKTTAWKLSYDGRNKEPVTLPVKFPLLLAQGVEGIAVGLASKILPHNFNELLDACVDYLQGREFVLYPDFPGGGLADVSRYNDGLRGGSVRVRTRITKLDKKTLVINDVPFGKTTSGVIDSILKANEKGKIKIRKIDDNTANTVEILVHLAPGISPDKTIDALYAFTDCEVPISPNSCVIENDRPRFPAVTEMLKISTDHTVRLLKLELEIRLAELSEDWHLSSLEKIFIENRIYLSIEECETWESVLETIDRELEPYKPLLLREVNRDDIVKLTEIKIKRISKYDNKKADEHIKSVEDEMEEVRGHLANLIPFAVNYFRQIKKKYGKGRERRTEMRSFDTIEASKVIVANEKLYVNRSEGFAGTSLRKDEYVGDCSDIDDIIVFRQDGSYVVTKVADKIFVGKNIIHIAVFRKNDKRTIYNIVYRDGINGAVMMKRVAVKGITRDKEYNITKGSKDSRIIYFSANPNGESEVVKVYLKPKPRLKNLIFDVDFGDLAIKGKNSIGNILTRHAVHKIVLKERGNSTLGGARIWFDEDINRLNSDGRGRYLGEFNTDDRILIVTANGRFRMSNFDVSNHYEDNILLLEKYRFSKVFSAVYFDGEKKFHYLKRFTFDVVEKLTSFIGDHEDSKLVSLTEVEYPRLEVSFGGKNKDRGSEIIEVADFIGVKSYKARGKRLTNYEISLVSELEPLIQPSASINDSEEEGSFELDEPDDKQMKLEL
ncbi:MAG: DNA gyrase/topoisomerase IV subunit A [Bacteroidales bacterium]